jgi:hypothetical protein
MESKPLIPATYIFSYWILIWAVIYIAIQYCYQFANKTLPSHIRWFNPSLVLAVASIWNTESLIKHALSDASANILFKQIVMILCIKLIPLWLVWTPKMNLYRDVAITILLFATYCIYLWSNGTDMVSVYEDLMVSLENDENRTPFEYWFNKIFGL